jgi:hypothetical protein
VKGHILKKGRGVVYLQSGLAIFFGEIEEIISERSFNGRKSNADSGKNESLPVDGGQQI